MFDAPYGFSVNALNLYDAPQNSQLVGIAPSQIINTSVFNTPPPKPQKSIKTQPEPIYVPDSDEDVPGGTDSGDAFDDDDDDYLPSPSVSPRKRLSALPHAPTRAAPTTTRLPGKRRTSVARSKTAHSGFSAPDARWTCPYCGYYQSNRRTPDLNRHIRIHTRKDHPEMWVCQGVPVEEAVNYNLQSDVGTTMWNGKLMIGGCMRAFSRRDALKRHLDNNQIGCTGNMAALPSQSGTG
jgi:hypothetical protein